MGNKVGPSCKTAYTCLVCSYKWQNPRSFWISSTDCNLISFWLHGSDPSLSPKVSCPIPSSSNFIQDISRRLHNDLVLKNPKTTHTSASSKQAALPEHQPESMPVGTNAPKLSKTSGTDSSVLPVQLSSAQTEPNLLGDAIIVKGTNEKMHSGQIWTEVWKALWWLDHLQEKR